MAKTSITRRIVIKDKEACERLARALETTPERKYSKKTEPSSYEMGKKLLTEHYSRNYEKL